MTATGANILPDDALAKPKALLRVALFGNYFRVDIGWLEFWVWVCSNGEKPNEEAYLSTKRISLAEAILLKRKKEAKLQALRQKLVD